MGGDGQGKDPNGERSTIGALNHAPARPLYDQLQEQRKLKIEAEAEELRSRT